MDRDEFGFGHVEIKSFMICSYRGARSGPQKEVRTRKICVAMMGSSLTL